MSLSASKFNLYRISCFAGRDSTSLGPMKFEQIAHLLSTPLRFLDPWGEEKRRLVSEQPFPAAWLEIVIRSVPLYSKLPAELQKQLQGCMQVFLSEKRFEGCGGLAITDEIRITIAAQACLLLLNRSSTYYSKTSTILVYPSSFVTDRVERSGSVEFVGQVPVSGVAWSKDYVILSWNDVAHGAVDISDGHNVVLHEFAHQLDVEDGNFNGTPILEQRSSYITWARVLSQEFEDFKEAVEKGSKTVCDDYGAESPAEFFAVLTETYFEKPKQLKKKHPELYEELKKFYQIDPAAWD